MFTAGLVLGFVLGGGFGFILFALCCAAKRGDE
jgi:hypothetical protein